MAADAVGAADTDSFESTGGGGPVEESDVGPGVADISTGFC